jgi:enamine deaminase RidA (YjgF/YER057c/UK114 family)
MPPEARPDPNFPYHYSGIARQVEYIHKNVDAICRAAGTSSRNLVKRRAIHLDLRELPEAEEVWKEKLADRLPPTTTFRIDGPLAVPGCTVQYDLIAYNAG